MEDFLVSSEGLNFYAIFDGHGGPLVSSFAKEHIISYLSVRYSFVSC